MFLRHPGLCAVSFGTAFAATPHLAVDFKLTDNVVHLGHL